MARYLIHMSTRTHTHTHTHAGQQVKGQWVNLVLAFSFVKETQHLIRELSHNWRAQAVVLFRILFIMQICCQHKVIFAGTDRLFSLK